MVEENPNSDGNFFMLNPWHVVMKLIDYADPDEQVEQDQLSAGFFEQISLTTVFFRSIELNLGLEKIFLILLFLILNLFSNSENNSS